MKKVILLSLIVVAIIFTLGSCNKSDCKHDDPTKIVFCEAQNATCQETGITQGMKCTLCDTMVVPQAVIPKIDCIESDWIVDKEASQIGDGIKHTECTMCHRKIQEELIPLVTSEGLEYTLNGDGESYSVTGIGTCSDTEIGIPSMYDGLPVTSIGDGAFEYCTSLTSIVIPDSVTTIGEFAFDGCDNLTHIVIPSSVTSIGYCAFSCPVVTFEVDGDNQYYKSIDGNIYTKDGKTLIQYATGKTEKNFEIPNIVTTIGGAAFSGCDSLADVVIPDSITSIGKWAFGSCDSLTSIVIPDSVTSIDEFAFAYCESLASVVIPESVMSIGGGVFSGCTSLTSIVIPNSVTSISNDAFYMCTSLTSIVIPDSVTSIGNWAFMPCSSLKDVYYTGSEEEWKLISIGFNNENLASATIHYNYVPEN